MTLSGIETTAVLGGLVTCRQPVDGYRFSVDSLLLAHFVLCQESIGQPFMDMGAGCGVIAALLGRSGWVKGTALEFQPVLATCARETLVLNGLSGIDVVHGDIRRLAHRFTAGSQMVVVSNPPYYARDASRPNPDPAIAAARHEIECTMNDLLSGARYLLPPGGRFYLVYPVARLTECLARAEAQKLNPASLRFIHPLPSQNASHVLLALSKSRQPSLKVLPPLVTHTDLLADGPWYQELLEWCTDC